MWKISASPLKNFNLFYEFIIKIVSKIKNQTKKRMIKTIKKGHKCPFLF